MYTQADINAAINYNKTAVITFYDITKSGQIRFDVRYMHTDALNKMLSRPITTQAEFEAFKKQVRKAVKKRLTLA